MPDVDECEHCKQPVRRCREPRPCSGQCSSGNGWIHLHGTHACRRRPKGWKGTGPYAQGPKLRENADGN
jgi:hypothetical protein